MATISIEQKKLLQLLRSRVYDDKATAVDAIKEIRFTNTSFDGAPLAVRYTTGTSVETLFVIFHNVDSETGYTIFDSATDGVLDDTSYDKTTGILTLTFKLADGNDKIVEVNLKDMLDIDDVLIASDSTKYLKLQDVTVVKYVNKNDPEDVITPEEYNNLDETEQAEYQQVTETGVELGTRMGTVAKPEISHLATQEDVDEGKAEKIGDKVVDQASVPAETGLADAEDVSEAIAEEVARLEEEIKELQADSISGVVVNGLTATVANNVASVEIKGSDIKVASSYTEVEYAEEFAKKDGVHAVAADDKISEALAKVESTVKVLVDEVLDNEEVSEKAIEALANAAGVINADGDIVYSVHTEDTILSAATSLDSADVALADAIRKVEAKSDTVVDALPEVGNSETLGANVTSEVDAVTKAKTYFVDVNFDFGTF